MEFTIGVMLVLIVGYLIGIMQGGIRIYTGVKPVAPKKQEEPQYNEDLSGMLPPEMQKYFMENNGQFK